MRITDKMMSGNYIKNLNNSLSDLNSISEQVSTGRSYQKASEDPATALKAYSVRNELSKNNVYQDNLKEIKSELDERETALTEINSILTSIDELIIKGTSDTSSESDRTTIANTLKGYQEELLSIGNTEYSGTFIFGGSDTNTKPFTVAGDGSLLYHGLNVNDGALFFDEHNYYDVGLGLQTDASGEVVEGTALDMACPGSELFGTGIDSDGITNNLYNLIGDIAGMFGNNNLTDIEAYSAKLEALTDDNLMQVVGVGTTQDFVSFLLSRYESSEDNLVDKQSLLEDVDSAEAIVEFNTQETAYNAALAMGTKILQYTLMDYLD